MNMLCISSSGMPLVAAMMPPISEEKVSQSRLTVRMSSAFTIDQKPGSSGNSRISLVKCTGHSLRRRLKKSCGTPSAHISSSKASMSSSGISDADIRSLLIAGVSG